VLDYPWELYDLTKDWTQYEDVAAKHPGKLKEMQDLFWIRTRKEFLDFPVATTSSAAMSSMALR
jgi:arylsulfatase A-like enzyme